MNYVSVKENVKWLVNEKVINNFSEERLLSWLKIGPKETRVNDIYFCDTNIVKEISNLKNCLNTINEKDFLLARSKCNPFEKIRNSIFLNRSAVKMANLDAILGYMFTDPRYGNNEPMLTNGSVLYFADCCAGPGGFSQYVLWRKKMQAIGFGFTLRNQNDFKLDQFFPGSTNSYKTYYGIKGDGNILDPENIESLSTFVHSQTNQRGVHFMMADGGVYVAHENSQEMESKQLVICQCLAGLRLVREEGSLIIKVFDVVNKFSVGLLYLMYKSFKQFTIVKPNSSRPANAERYIVFKYKKAETEIVQKYLFHVIKKMWYGDVEILELVPNEIICQDQNFMNYILDSNNNIGRKQVLALSKIINFITTGRVELFDSEDIKFCCLHAWKLPIQQQHTVIFEFILQMVHPVYRNVRLCCKTKAKVIC